MSTNTAILFRGNKRRGLRRFKANWQLLLLCVPSIVMTLLFHYFPMFGLLLPFKQYKYAEGILGSKWIGLTYFKLFFNMPDMWRLIRNTVGYSILFMVLDLFLNVFTAVLLYDISDNFAKKIYQSSIMIPNFMSWVIVGYITYAILNPSLGIMSRFLNALGKNNVDVYANTKYWPFILTAVHRWQGKNGYLMYYANLMAIDPQLFEAAAIDGANGWQMKKYISLPSLIPLMCMMTIMAIGGLFSGDFGLFYQIPMDVGALYETTDIINTYVYRGLNTGNYSISSSVGLLQSAIGFVLILVVNAVVRKISPENSMF